LQPVGCVESELGVVLLRVAVTNILVTQCGLATFRYMSGYYGRVLDFEPAEMVISTLSDQGVVWIGSMVSPVMPAIGFMGNVVTFGLQRWALLNACAPVRTLPLRHARVDLVGSHGRWKRPCLQTAHMTI
jgi:hypothetical protein